MPSYEPTNDDSQLTQWRNDHDAWIDSQWTAVNSSKPNPSQQLLVKGVADPALLSVLPTLLTESLNSETEAAAFIQVEALLRHLEIRKKSALLNWTVSLPQNLHPGIMLVTAQQLARLSSQRDDVRYLNTALKMLDWMRDTKSRGTADLKNLYQHAEFECAKALEQWSEGC